ncbi:hypothetical protein O206_21365 [Ochrobactrum sp. EGD-AQ16]|nr:hypothetical protein O206_21365 [Ochrobactrum sp. EGD-AQ16]
MSDTPRALRAVAVLKADFDLAEQSIVIPGMLARRPM